MIWNETKLSKGISNNYNTFLTTFENTVYMFTGVYYELFKTGEMHEMLTNKSCTLHLRKKASTGVKLSTVDMLDVH